LATVAISVFGRTVATRQHRRARCIAPFQDAEDAKRFGEQRHGRPAVPAPFVSLARLGFERNFGNCYRFGAVEAA
jgi:hypothetical protein